MKRWLLMALLLVLAGQAHAEDPWLVLNGASGPGKGKHIVLVSGDEEYRSEEALPQLAKILAQHHGLKCTLLFALNPEDGKINQNKRDNIPGLKPVRDPDLTYCSLRFGAQPHSR